MYLIYLATIFALLCFSNVFMVDCVECQMGYEIRLIISGNPTDIKNVTSRNCTEWIGSDSVCLRMEATATVAMAANGLSVPGTAVYSDCRPRNSCSDVSCQKILLNQIMGTALRGSVTNAEIKKCAFGCCNTNDCNINDIDTMDVLGPVPTNVTTAGAGPHPPTTPKPKVESTSSGSNDIVASMIILSITTCFPLLLI